jgi:hypothetical protein
MGTGSEKIRTILGLVMVILLVFITNRLDQKHFEDVQGTITTIYEDRVVAQYDLFQLTNLLSDHQLKMSEGEIVAFDKNGEVDRVMTEYGQTTLTKREEEIFGRLKENLNKLSASEFIPQGPATETAFARIHENLEELSAIQVKESKTLKIQAQDSLDSSNLMSNMEMILIIIFGVVLQFVLFSGRKRKTEAETK